MVCFTTAGLVIFFMAPKLCTNTFFHYTATPFHLMPIVVLTYLLQRRFKQTLFFLLCCLLYMMTRTWFNIKQNFLLVVGLVTLVGLLTFAILCRTD